METPTNPPVARSRFFIISIGRLEATADAGGDIRRSSQLDHSKEPDLYFSELYWSSFLGSVQKTVTEAEWPIGKICLYVFAQKSTSARKSAFHQKVATNDRYSFFGEAELTFFVGHRYGSEVRNCKL